jgi:hypothetical protein
MLPNYKDIFELIKAGSTIEAQEKIMELRQAALEIQEQNLILRKRVRELEDQLKATDNWEDEKTRYSLISLYNGPSQVYALKKSESNGEAPHFLCTNCFESRTKAILNPMKKDRNQLLVCPKCKSTTDTGFSSIGQAAYAEDHANGG